MPKYHLTFRSGTAQRAQDSSTLLFADPAILLRIIEPQIMCEFPEKVRVELAHCLHLVVRHGQRRVDGARRPQEAKQDLQLICWPGRPLEEERENPPGDDVFDKV